MRIQHLFGAVLLLCLSVAAPAQKPKAQAPDKTVFKGPKLRAIVTGMDVKVQGVVTSAPTPSGTTTVVTLDIQQPTEFGTGLTDMLVTALSQCGRFTLLDRQNLDDIQKEKALAQGADFDPKTAVKANRLLGAQIIVRGAVTELKVKKSGSNANGAIGETVDFSQARSEAIVGIDLKIVDAATAEVLASVRAEGKSVAKAQSFNLNAGDIKIGASVFENSVLGQAVRSAIEDAVGKIVKDSTPVVWEGRVATVSGKDDSLKIYVNAGVDSGLKVGDVLEVFRAGEEIIDPETQASLGFTQGERVGSIRIVELQKKFSVAVMVDGSGFAKEDVVHFLAAKAPTPPDVAAKPPRL